MLRLSNRKTDQRERMRDGQPGSLEREKERESQWGKKKQKKARWADKHRVNHGEAPQCRGRMENGSAGLGRVSRSVRGLALSMLTGRQPVYRERKKKKASRKSCSCLSPIELLPWSKDGRGEVEVEVEVDEVGGDNILWREGPLQMRTENVYPHRASLRAHISQLCPSIFICSPCF